MEKQNMRVAVYLIRVAAMLSDCGAKVSGRMVRDAGRRVSLAPDELGCNNLHLV